MNRKHLLTLACASALTFTLGACGGDPHSNHEDDHDSAHDSGHPHPHDGDDDHDSSHAHKEAGPNGGRILTAIEPHAEFLVLEDRRVQITFLDGNDAPAPLEGRVADVVAGERSDPTSLSFEREGESLVSTAALPEGDDYPLVVTLRATPESEPVREKFTLDLSDCPTCEYREYACICDH